MPLHDNPLAGLVALVPAPPGAVLCDRDGHCRRAERSVVALARAEKAGAQVSMPARRYLNRLSDLLFVAGRVLNRHAGQGDVQWRHQRKKP